VAPVIFPETVKSPVMSTSPVILTLFAVTFPSVAFISIMPEGFNFISEPSYLISKSVLLAAGDVLLKGFNPNKAIASVKLFC
jgi:hypothetical protein